MLFEMAREVDSLDQTARELQRIADLLESTPEARARALGKDVGKEGLGELVDALGSAAKVFADLHKAYSGVQEAFVESAVPLQKDLKSEIEERLRRRAKGKLQMKFSVNQDLLAGFKVRIGEQVIDCSTASQLKQMRAAMGGTRKAGHLDKRICDPGAD